MPETGNLTQEKTEQPDMIGTADVVIGLPGLQTSDDLHWATQLAGIGQRVLIAYPNTVPRLNSDGLAGSHYWRYEVASGDRLHSPLYGSFQDIFQVSQRASAKCCCVWNSDPRVLSVEIIEQLVTPALTQEFDLVIPRYQEMKFGALINSGILCPAVRAIYGKRISFPMAIDLCFSAKFIDRLSQVDPKSQRPRSQQWIAAEAICGAFNICEANLSMDPPRPPESTDVSTILALVVGRLFQDLERNAIFWQRPGGSQPVPVFGERIRRELSDEVTVDVQPMIETFHLGYKNLREIWSVALPPGTFLELKRLTTLPATAFRMPDDLWVRIVYDFALAHRQRAINREHLLKAMTPLYLAWVASHAVELKDATPPSFDSSLERLALAYEKQKPYLLSRWRWPDRFNP